MSIAADKIIEQLELLPPEEQDEVSVRLNFLLDPDDYDPMDDPEFRAELERRIADADEHPEKLMSWDEARARIERDLAEIQSQRSQG